MSPTRCRCYPCLHGLIGPSVGIRRQIRQSIADRVVEIEAAVNGPRVEARAPHAWPSALFSRISTTWLLLVTSLRDHTSAAAPATCGVAIDVPLFQVVAPGIAGRRRAAARGHRIGRHNDAARRRNVHPASVVGKRSPLVVRIERADRDHIVECSRIEEIVVPSFPAPATMTRPAFQASCTASSRDCE